ncbi:MAG: lactate utilization protein [Rhodospirillales bacterium]
MSDARSHILATIRTALGRDKLSPETRAALEARLAAPKPSVIPARGMTGSKIGPRGAHNELIERFLEESARVDATNQRVQGLDAVPGAVAAYVDGAGLPGRLRAMPDPILQTLSWSGTNLEVVYGAAVPQDAVGLGIAAAGVAETGTLVMVSGAQTPVTVNFLPESAVVVLPARRIVGSFEDAWAAVRAQSGGKNVMPRAVNLITGPSRTADIEQTLLLGAHGPGRLHILVADDA